MSKELSRLEVVRVKPEDFRMVGKSSWFQIIKFEDLDGTQQSDPHTFRPRFAVKVNKK